MTDIHERCFLCAFWSGSRCTQTWRLAIHIEPLGGIIDISTTPGMIPEELKQTITKFFQDFIGFLTPQLETFPFWEKITEYQKNHPEAEACPGRREREDIKPYLQIVRTPL